MKEIMYRALLCSFLRVSIAVIGILIFFFFLSGMHTLRKGKIIGTKVTLKTIRENVQWFKEETGRWPSSLSEIYKYVVKHNINYEGVLGVTMFRGEPMQIFEPSYYKEYISLFRGNCVEHKTLNDQGGIYYNNQTGEVKVNLNKPVRSYIKIYFGRERNEIPSEW